MKVGSDLGAWRHLTAVGLAAAVLVSGYSSAEAVSQQVRRACTGDYKRLCPGYKVNSPALRACMESKWRDISNGCMNALVDAGEVSRSRSRR